MNTACAMLLCFAASVVPCGSHIDEPGPSLVADDWIIRNWAVDEGLPESSATAMVQTADQYLWFGTFGGLVRFDGVKFVVFDPDNTPQLPSPSIVNLHADRRGRLWISTFEGLVVRDGERWLDFTNDPALGDKPAFIRTFAERENGSVLLTTFGGEIVECAEETLVRLPDPPGDPDEGYWGGVDDDGRWWAAQNKFVGSWDGKHWEAKLPLGDFQQVGNENAICGAARDGGLWVIVNDELRKYSHGVEVSRRKLSDVPLGVWSLFEDSRGTLWMPSYSVGLYSLPANGRMRCFQMIGAIPCRSYRFVFEDRERNLWIGTNASGLLRLTARRFHDLGTRGAFSAPVTSVARAAGDSVWVATYGDGLFRLDENGLTMSSFSGHAGFGFSISSVLTDLRGRTWVGLYYGFGLFVFDDTGGRYVREGQMVGGTVIALFEDSLGRVWVSGGEKVAAEAGDTAKVYGADEGLPAGEVVCFAEDRDGVIWLSNLSGVFRLAGDRFVEVLDSNGSPIRDVACLRCDGEGTMWLGSNRNGLLRWREGALATIGPESGLASKRVLGILDDGAGFFWMSSDRGVMRVARGELNAVADKFAARLKCQVFDTTDGLPTIECSGLRQPVCTRDAAGNLWFATTKGVGKVDLDRLRLDSTPPEVHVEEIKYRKPANGTGDSGAAAQTAGSPFTSRLELPAGSRGIEIHYTAPVFAAPAKALFEIQLEPVDTTWRKVGNRRVAYYDDLQAGQYRFRVRACNGDGVWNEVGASLQFSVLPYFWETLLFRVLFVIFLCGTVLAWAYRFRGRLIRRQALQAAFTHQLIARQEAERNRVASELHDSLGHMLLLVKNRLVLLAKRERHAASAGEQLDEVSADVTRAIAEVRSISQALRPSTLTQVGLTHAITWMVEELRSATDIDFVTELDDIDGVLAPEMEINLYRIVQEGLSNVVKHAAASRAVVRVAKHPSAVCVQIQDNGCGFDARRTRRKTQQSFGLTGMIERTNLLNGHVEWETAPGAGTRITVTVPVPGQPT